MKVLLDRGMNLKECSKLWNADFMPLREMAFFRGLYVTRFRPNELLYCDIEDLDRKNQYLTARMVKRRRNPKTQKTYRPPPKTRKLDDTTFRQFLKLISNRKKGPIFITRTGKRCKANQFKRAIHDYAETLGIQKVKYITDGGKNYYLVSLSAIREAGERHEIGMGGSELIAAKCSDHTKRVQEKHYAKMDFEEIVAQQEKHHPFFQGDKDE
jgi:integrase